MLRLMFAPLTPGGEILWKNWKIIVQMFNTSKAFPPGAGLIGSKKVQRTIIFVASFIRIPLRCSAPKPHNISVRCTLNHTFENEPTNISQLCCFKIRTNQPCPFGGWGLLFRQRPHVGREKCPDYAEDLDAVETCIMRHKIYVFS